MRKGTFLAVAASIAAVALAGCARSVFPPGGPVDSIAPRVVATTPADSSVRVPADAAVEILFSEAMDRATVRDGIRVYPPPGRPVMEWSGRRFRLSWDRPLAERTTYNVLLSGSARDARNVPMGVPLTIRFTTGDVMDRGRVNGVLRAKTLPRGGVPVLAFADSLGPRPDTTGSLPSYATETDSGGVYSLGGLPTGRGFTVHAVYDLNRNGAIDRDGDLFVSYPDVIRLTDERAEADSINLVAVDPRSPAILQGSIASPDSASRYRIEAFDTSDSTLFRRVERTGPGEFTLRVPAGTYRLKATRLPPADSGGRGIEIRRDQPIDAKAEQEYGPFHFDFEAVREPEPGIAPPLEGEE